MTTAVVTRIRKAQNQKRYREAQLIQSLKVCSVRCRQAAARERQWWHSLPMDAPTDEDRCDGPAHDGTIHCPACNRPRYGRCFMCHARL
jgi:hypothetical protein